MVALPFDRSKYALTALAAIMASALLVVDAVAQDRGGLFSRTRTMDASESEAARVYADARADLDAERPRDAQRKLELFVARYPDSALADVARRDLKRIYDMASPLSPPIVLPQGAQRLPIQAAPVAIHSAGPTAVAPSIVVPGAGPGAGHGPIPNGASGGGAVSPAVRSASEDFRQQAGDRVFFGDNSADLGGRARFALEAQANWLLRHPDVRILIEGHADDQGARDLNRHLAEKRAEAVRLRLNDLGVDADRIRVSAHGRNEPVADCPEQHCRAQNRRVVTTIVHVPSTLGFDDAGRRSLRNAAGAVGQPASAPRVP